MKVLLVLLITTFTVQAQYFISNAAGGNPEGVDARQVPIGSLSDIARDAQGNTYIAQRYRIRKIDAAGKITTIAGTGERGVSGDGSLAITTKLGSIKGMAMDAQGNIYLTINEYYIRKITAATGIITTIAGTGSWGYSGDGGPAKTAAVSNVQGIAVDANGNLYFADGDKVRKIEASTNIISTIAGSSSRGFAGDGGLATAAKLNNTEGIAVDAHNNVYISDKSNRRVRKIEASTGIITTIAGTGSSGFSGDGGLATAAQISSVDGIKVDAAGNIYIADLGNNRIRKIDAITGIISTIMGNGGSGFTGAGGPATDAGAEPYRLALDPQGDVYFIDDHYYYAGKVAVNTGQLIQIAGNGNSGYSSGYWGDGGLASKAGFENPQNIAKDATGNLYIVDRNNHRVRKIDVATGIITTIAGNGTRGFSGDGGLATMAQLNSPAGIAIDASGNIYIADGSNNRIRKVDVSNGMITTIAGTGVGGYSGDGGLAIGAQFWGVDGLAIDASGNLYITDTDNSRIRKVDMTTGIVTTVVGNGVRGYGGNGGPATAASLRYPSDVAVDKRGNIYVVDGSGTIRKVDAVTGIINAIVGGSGAYPGDGGAATGVAIGNPQSITLDASDNVYIGSGQARIFKITTDGKIYRIAGTGSSSFNGNRGNANSINIGGSLQGMVVADNGDIYCADASNHVLRRITLASIIGLKQNTTTITNAGSQDFGSTSLAATKNIDFTIENTGSNNLHLENITVTEGFRIVGTPAKEVATGSNTTITIVMDAANAGLKSGTLTVLSNDITNGTFSVTLSGTVTKASQTITFDALSTKTYGEADFTLSATGGASGSPINYVSSNANVAKVSGNKVTIVGVGIANITAKQAGNNNYKAANDVSQTLVVSKANQSITFDALPTKTYGDQAFAISATGGGSGNAVTFKSSNPKVATVSGNLVTVIGAGTTTITASQAGDANYNTANDVLQALTVNKVGQIITFDLGTNATKIVGDAAFDLTATGGASGNAITYISSNTAVATISGNTVTIVGPGTTTITASQAGNTNYQAAQGVNQTLTVNQTTALAENLGNAQLTLFPNPTVNVVYFRIQGQIKSTEVNVTVLDRQGAVVLKRNQRLINGEMTLPIHHLAAGYYLFKIKIGEETILRRIIKN